MESTTEPKSEIPSSLMDVRSIPLKNLSETSSDSLRRIIPASNSARIPVASFNASL
jgi:hypothetical protein